MRVTRLEIFGFKSFVDRFVLNFDKNMIGIVGPNGCGKSNVVDALRWVLGESHAKHLRGGSFDDLIFNGSDSRRQLGMAEVSLTIRPEPNWKEKIESESQSQAEDLLSALSEDENIEIKVNDSSEISDKVVPIRKFANENDQEENQNNDVEVSVQAEESSPSSRLDMVGDKVSSIPGLFDASEIQFTRRLYRSGESEYFINKAPCRLRDMQDLYRLIGLGARGLSIVQQGQIGQFISKKPIERRELLEEAAGISGFRTKMEAASRRLEKTDENLARVSDILIEVEKQLKTLRRQAARAKARQSLKDELTTAERELYQIKSARLAKKISEAASILSLNTQEVETLRASLQEKDTSIMEIEAALHEIDVELMSVRREKDEHSRVLLAEENKLQETRIKLATLDSKESHLKQTEQQDTQRLAQLSQEIDNLEALKVEKLHEKEEAEKLLDEKKAELSELERVHLRQIEDFQAQISSNSESSENSSVNAELLELSRQIEETEASLQNFKVVEQNLHEAQSNVKGKERALVEAERTLTKIKSELQAIEKQLSSLASHSLKVTSQDGQEEKGKVFLSLLNIPQNLEKAVHAVLGEKANFLVSQNANERLKLYLASIKKATRVGVINSDASFSNDIDVSVIPGINKLLEMISFEDADKSIISNMLGNVWIADNAEVAIEFRNKLASDNVNDFSIVLGSGEVLTPWGWYSTEGEGLHFSFTRRKAELLQEEERAGSDVERIRTELLESETIFNMHRQEISTLNEKRANLSDLQRKTSQLLKQQGEEEKRRFQALRYEENKLRQNLREVERQFSRGLSEVEQNLARIRSQYSNLETQENRLSQDKSRVEHELSLYPDKYQDIVSQREDLYRSSSEAQMASSSQESVDRKSRIRELDSVIEETENVRLSKHQELSEMRLEISDVRRSIEQIDRNIRSSESERDRATIEIDMLKEDFNRYYPEDSFDELQNGSDNLLETLGESLDSRLKELTETSNSIRKRLEREGEVDPQSIELCEQEEIRFESMTTQHKDLLQAKETLERTIKQLKELSKIRFVNTFTAVNTKFKELIPRLFSGGSGHLELVNPEDPLQSGVDIVVRPPGKKITTMELMSGGEKALVATAVLVSMFLHHPGPICVLDEIDAPLDDANLVKLLDLVKEIAHRTQFLVITHNKITMQAVDRLIGITMQESGVTTALTVTLDEAEKELEKLVANG